MASASSCSAARTTSSTRAVVAEVDHLRALPLDQPPHDVDRGVVAVEQAGGGDEAQRAGLGLGGRGDFGGGGAHGGGAQYGSWRIPHCSAGAVKAPLPGEGLG